MKKAFTLLELLVVIAILGILAAVILPSLSTARGSARDAKRVAEIKQFETAIKMYYLDNGFYPFQDISDFNYANEGYDEVYTASHVVPANKPSGSGWRLYSELETVLSPYMAELPLDPMNSGSIFSTTGYSYQYYINGDGQVMLSTKFEENNNLRCETNGYTFFVGVLYEDNGFTDGPSCHGTHGKTIQSSDVISLPAYQDGTPIAEEMKRHYIINLE